LPQTNGSDAICLNCESQTPRGLGHMTVYSGRCDLSNITRVLSAPLIDGRW